VNKNLRPWWFELKFKKLAGTGDMIQVVEHVPSKCQTLNSNPVLKKKSSPGIVAHPCNPSYLGGRGRRIMHSTDPRKVSKTPSLKKKNQNQNKSTGSVAQVVEHLLDSIPSTAINK
jgi:hypothetical protein